jgi:hypothetical protein
MVSSSLIIVERFGMLLSGFIQSYHFGKVLVISSNLIIVKRFGLPISVFTQS